MAIYKWDNQLLTEGGALAVHQDCCCDEEACPSDCSAACNVIAFTIRSRSLDANDECEGGSAGILDTAIAETPEACCKDGDVYGYDADFDFWYERIFDVCLYRCSGECQWATQDDDCAGGAGTGLESCANGNNCGTHSTCPKGGDGAGTEEDPTLEGFYWTTYGEWVLYCQDGLWILESVSGDCAQDAVADNPHPAFSALVDPLNPAQPPIDPTAWSLINKTETCCPDCQVCCVDCVCDN